MCDRREGVVMKGRFRAFPLCGIRGRKNGERIAHWMRRILFSTFKETDMLINTTTPSNGPSKTGQPSGKGRGNNPPRSK